MASRKTLTDKMVAKLKPGPKRVTLPDPELIGHYVRVTPTGAKSYVAVAREPYAKKQVWTTIGTTDLYTIADAREKAREILKRIKAGLPAFEPPAPAADSFFAVAENYLARHVRAQGLRSESEITRILQNQVYPIWKGRAFEDIRRADVAKLLDAVQDTSGPSAADHVLAVVRGLMNWYATRSNDYVVPIARGMRRTDPKNRTRDRILDDDEIRRVWAAAEADGPYGAFVRLALLTGQRREKVAAMRWNDVTVDGVWTIPAEDREKGSGKVLVLPEVALAIIKRQPRIGVNRYVFAGRGAEHFVGYSPLKKAFDKKVGEIPRWTIHDLRRTAGSLLARAGVRPDIVERVLGHVIPGVRGIYDRHSYLDEKKHALERLAGLIDTILSPPDKKVVPIRSQS